MSLCDGEAPYLLGYLGLIWMGTELLHGPSLSAKETVGPTGLSLESRTAKSRS